MSKIVDIIKNEKKIICPACKEQGLKSKVWQVGNAGYTIGGTWTYSEPQNEEYWDEDGEFHSHYMPAKIKYQCSNNHMWDVQPPPDPCWCGWPEPEKNRKADENIESLAVCLKCGTAHRWDLMCPVCFPSEEK